jgi:hypothetical protein
VWHEARRPRPTGRKRTSVFFFAMSKRPIPPSLSAHFQSRPRQGPSLQLSLQCAKNVSQGTGAHGCPARGGEQQLSAASCGVDIACAG